MRFRLLKAKIGPASPCGRISLGRHQGIRKRQIQGIRVKEHLNNVLQGDLIGVPAFKVIDPKMIYKLITRLDIAMSNSDIDIGDIISV